MRNPTGLVSPTATLHELVNEPNCVLPFGLWTSEKGFGGIEVVLLKDESGEPVDFTYVHSCSLAQNL
jgi:hypothetical protein